MDNPPLSDRDFERFRSFIHDAAGISLAPAKKALVTTRLARRLQARGLRGYDEYLKLLSDGSAAAEAQIAIDLLTTNETYFFRESRHFDLLRRLALAHRGNARPFRVWSAACSSGEEPYSMAMVLADCLGDGAWEVFGSDISTRVLARARTGHYPLERTSHIPPGYLKRFCLRGTGNQDGTLLVERALRERVGVAQVNLNDTLPQIGEFDVVFLRNVLIYFDADTKRAVVERVLARLRGGGHFCIGHSENLHGVTGRVVALAPSIYRKEAGVAGHRGAPARAGHGLAQEGAA